MTSGPVVDTPLKKRNPALFKAGTKRLFKVANCTFARGKDRREGDRRARNVRDGERRGIGQIDEHAGRCLTEHERRVHRIEDARVDERKRSVRVVDEANGGGIEGVYDVVGVATGGGHQHERADDDTRRAEHHDLPAER
jgi:hypothetical protein